MVTMTIQFNQAMLEEKKMTTEKLLEKFDDYCVKHQVARPRTNVFEKDGQHALAVIGNIMIEIEKDKSLLDMMEQWYWIIDGEKEDILEDAYEWNRKLVPQS